MRAPGSAAPSPSWRAAWSLQAEGDDGNPWVTGACWLYCRRQGVRVLWIGPVRAPGADADVYGCGQCVAELAAMARQQTCVRDAVAGAAAPTVPAAAPQPLQHGRPTSRGAGFLLHPRWWVAPQATVAVSPVVEPTVEAKMPHTGTCWHCTTQTIRGKTHCAVCKAQLYL